MKRCYYEVLGVEQDAGSVAVSMRVRRAEAVTPKPSPQNGPDQEGFL